MRCSNCSQIILLGKEKIISINECEDDNIPDNVTIYYLDTEFNDEKYYCDYKCYKLYVEKLDKFGMVTTKLLNSLVLRGIDDIPLDIKKSIEKTEYENIHKYINKKYPNFSKNDKIKVAFVLAEMNLMSTFAQFCGDRDGIKLSDIVTNIKHCKNIYIEDIKNILGIHDNNLTDEDIIIKIILF